MGIIFLCCLSPVLLPTMTEFLKTQLMQYLWPLSSACVGEKGYYLLSCLHKKSKAFCKLSILYVLYVTVYCCFIWALLVCSLYLLCILWLFASCFVSHLVISVYFFYLEYNGDIPFSRWASDPPTVKTTLLQIALGQSLVIPKYLIHS